MPILALLILSFFVAMFEGLLIALITPLFSPGQSQGYFDITTYIPYLQFNAKAPVEFVRNVAIAIVIVSMLKGLTNILYAIVISRVQIDLIKTLRLKCMDQLLQLSLGYLHSTNPSNVLTLSTVYTKAVGSLVSQIGMAIPKVFSTLVLFLMLLSLSVKLTVVSLSLVLTCWLIFRFAGKLSGKTGELYVHEYHKLSQVLNSTIAGMLTVRSFGREDKMRKDFGQFVDSHGSAALKNSIVISSTQPLFETTMLICLSLILYFATLLLPLENGQWMNVLLAFVVILFRLIQPFSYFQQVVVAAASLMPQVKEVFQFIATADKTYIIDGSNKVESFNQTIAFDNVSFSYRNSNRSALRNVSMTIRQGERIALVGPSGSGKSTIVSLLLRFFDPDSGTIQIDGKDLTSLVISNWRKLVGVVSQENFLFNCSILDNIAFADPTISREQVIAACQLVGASEFIENLPAGYDSNVGERGVLLSGGQKQRLAIARAIVKNPSILIFDEATSALDSESERVVQEAFDKVASGRTIIIVAHRLSTVVDANRILVLDHGQIVESGTHNELLRQRGLYHRMVELQSLEISAENS